MKKALLYLSMLLAGNTFAQLPNTDIWLFDLNSVKEPYTVSNPVNITNRAGYDNQPCFSADGNSILFTSIRDGKQSDIYKYDLKTKKTTQVTNTSTTSEYSPTFMPDKMNMSVVMVEPDSVQRLWKFPLKGGMPSLVVKEIDSVGYHCWIGKDKLALCIITDPMNLIVYDIYARKTFPMSDTVGRSIHYKNDKLFYVDGNKIYSYDGKKTFVCAKEFKSEDIAFVDNSHLLLAENTDLYSGSVYTTDKQGNWQKIADLSNLNIQHITRIAVSPDKRKIAIVAETK